MSIEETVELSQDLRQLKIEAVTFYTRHKYAEAEAVFQRAIELVKTINPEHKEVEVLQRSILSCRSKASKQSAEEALRAPDRAISDHPLLMKLRNELICRGARGFAGLSKRFKAMDVS